MTCRHQDCYLCPKEGKKTFTDGLSHEDRMPAMRPIEGGRVRIGMFRIQPRGTPS
jgi:hypothetical protein